MDYTFLSKEEITKHLNVFSQTFNVNVDQLNKDLTEWEKAELNIAIIGESGCGKSTLINAMRGLYPSDANAANTNILECTLKPTPYPYPNNRNIILWDLPGVNTPNFPMENYLTEISKNPTNQT